MELFVKAKSQHAEDLGDGIGSLFGRQEIEHVLFFGELPLLRVRLSHKSVLQLLCS